NPAVSNGSMMTAPGFSSRLQALRQRGGKVILIDPRRNETARLLTLEAQPSALARGTEVRVGLTAGEDACAPSTSRHVFIRPGTDVFLLLSLVHVVFQEQLTRMDRLGSFTNGVESVQRLVAEFSPERVTSVTGIEAEEIRRLAREFAE